MRAGRITTVLVLSLVAAVTTAPAREAFKGRSLGEVLDRLRADGLNLVYSSAVVDVETRVPVEPDSAEPIAALREILATLGLQLKAGPGDSWLIVPGAPPQDGIRDAAAAARRLGDALGFRTEIQVTPGRRRVDASDDPASRELEREDVLLVPAIGGDVGRIVERLPGVSSTDNSAAWNVRGSIAGDSALVLDGLELYDPYHLREFQSPFTLIDPRVVDRIDFLPGGFTVEYGDRHGAFVEIATRNDIDDAVAEIGLGTMNSRFSYRAPRPRGDGAWLVSSRFWYPEALLDTIGLATGERLRPRFADAYAKTTKIVSPRTVRSLHGLFSFDRIAFLERGEDVNERVDATSRHANLWARWIRVPSELRRSETVVSAGFLERVREGIAARDDGPTEVRDRRELVSFGASHGLVWTPSGSTAVKAGVSVRRLQSRYRYDLREQGAGSPLRAARLDPDGWQFGLYGAVRHRFGARHALEFGLRADRQTVAGDAQIAPRAHWIWSPDDRTEIRLAAGRYEQSQRVHELDVADGETSFAEAEVSEQIDAMARRRLGDGVVVRLDLYRRELSNLRTRYENLFEPVELFPETTEDRIALSPPSATLQGIELTLADATPGDWRWWVAVTRAEAVDTIEGIEEPRSWDQRNTLKFLVGWSGHPRWRVAVSGTAHDGRPRTPMGAVQVVQPGGGIDVEPVPGPRNSARLDDYLRLDLKLSRTFERPGGRWTLALDVQNLTDRDNVCCVSDFIYTPRSDGSVDVVTEFDPWLGLTPTFAVIWESRKRSP